MRWSHSSKVQSKYDILQLSEAIKVKKPPVGEVVGEFRKHVHYMLL